MRYVKKIVAAGLIIASTQTLMSGTISIIRSGGGPNGYNKVTEFHAHGGSHHSLICSGVGYDKCEWIRIPKYSSGPGGSSVGIEDLVQFAESRLSKGSTSGSHTANLTIGSDLWYRSVTWSSSSTSQTIQIEINLAE